VTGTDIPRTIADRVYGLLLLAYPAQFRDRFGAGMRYAFSRDLEPARRAGLVDYLRFWLTTIVDTIRSGFAERSERRPRRREERTPMKSWFVVDWRDGWRSLRATPAVTAVAVLSLALGIGANTALFSILNSLMLKSLPVVEADRLVLLAEDSWTNPIWEEIRARQEQIADGALAWSNERFNLSATGETDPVDGIFASGRMFDVLGVPAIRGRTFRQSDDDRRGGPDGPVAVISYGFWQRRFAGADDAVGRTLSINRTPFTIVGVTPRGFFGPEVGRSADVMLPLGTEAIVRGVESSLDGRSSWWLNIMLRLRRDQTLAQVTERLRGVQDQIRVATMPQRGKDVQSTYLRDPFVLVPAASGRSTLRARYELPLRTLMGVVGLVLLIACANIANLLMARATARRHELSVRLALGASRLRLSRHLRAESLMLAGAGAMLALLFARWGSQALVAQLSSVGNRVYLDMPLDWRVLAFTIGVAAATAILFGVAPALTVNRVSPNEALKEQGRGASGERRAGLRQALVVLQVALSLMLVVTASLFARTLFSLTTRNAGFDRTPVLVASVTVNQPAEQRVATFERLRAAAAEVPGVSDAAISLYTPVSRGGWNTMIVVPPDSPLGRRERMSWINVVSPGWFKTYGIHLASGRDFDGRDRIGAPLVAVVNRAFAHRFLKGGDPVGQLFSEQGPSGAGDTFEVVGLVEDTVYRSLRAPMEPTMFRPSGQWEKPGASIALGVRSAGSPPVSLTRSVSEALGRADTQASMTFFTLSSHVDASLLQERLLATLSTFFGGLALLLASLGLYGVTSYSVNRRRAEIGIRMALGADASDVVRMVLARVGMLVVIGVAIGTGASVWASRFVASFVYGFSATDPVTFVGAALVLSLVAAAAGWLPARRASRIDPTSVLRDV
jgi:putative ABC transport system permease protein